MLERLIGDLGAVASMPGGAPSDHGAIMLDGRKRTRSCFDASDVMHLVRHVGALREDV